MYLYCIKTGKPAGEERRWDDIPVQPNLNAMRSYAFHVFGETKDYLLALEENRIYDELNRLTPAPWGEMRPTFLNLWGGIIEHALQHTMQIAVRKEYIRQRF
jgi:hypothetical protein